MNLQRLESKLYKKYFNITDVAVYADAQISQVIEDSTKYFESLEFDVDFKNCVVTIEGDLNWIYNDIPEVVDFIRFKITKATITYESGSESNLSDKEISIIQDIVKLG